jgi:hypothetical protein
MSKRNVGEQFAKALELLEERERKLARAFNAWNKTRNMVRALQKRIDTETAADMATRAAQAFGGKCVMCKREVTGAEVNFLGVCAPCRADDEPALGDTPEARAMAASMNDPAVVDEFLRGFRDDK